MNQALIDYLATLAQSHIALRDALRTLTEQVAQMNAFDPTPIIQQLAALEARVTTQGEQIAELSGRVGSIDTRTTDQTAVITALASKVAEIQQAGQADLSGLPQL
jgi:uncharacterized coiled-coil protein SlyX